jgi:hypothetical protein
MGPWVAFALLLLWLVVPLEFAYRRFAGGDLA